MTALVVTGGAGYLGRRVARRALAESDLDVILHVRADSGATLAARTEELERYFGRHRHRVSYVGGDLADDDALAEVDRTQVAGIVHAAAVTRFNVDADTAARANVLATAKVLAFADRCPALGSLSLLSTIYSSGLRPGVIGEARLDDSFGFANHYEASKWQAEELLWRQYPHLPLRILRVATVIAEDDGTVSQYNAFHNTLKLYFYGLLSLLPGSPSTRLYFVTGGFAADAVWRLSRPDVDAGVYHIAHGGDLSPTLEEVITIAFDTFAADGEFRRRRVLRPLYVDRDTFSVFSDGVGGFAAAPVTQAVSSMTPFAPQLYVDKDVCNRQLRGAWEHYRATDAGGLIAAACEHLVESRWGRRSWPAA